MKRLQLLLLTLVVLLSSSTYFSVNGLWQQRKNNEYRTNTIDFRANHTDWTKSGILHTQDYSQIQNTLVVNEKSGMAYAAFSSSLSNSIMILKVNLISGEHSVVFGYATRGQAVGAVLSDVHYYVLVGNDDYTVLVSFNLERETSHGLLLPVYGTPQTISLAKKPECVVVVSSRMIGTFQPNTLYEMWRSENVYSDKNGGLSSSLLVNTDDDSYEMLYLLTTRLEKFRVADGLKYNKSVELSYGGQPRNLVSLGRENFVAITSTRSDTGASYFSVVNFENGQLETQEIIPRVSTSIQFQGGCDIPTTISTSSNFRVDTYKVAVSCTDSMNRVYNVFTTTHVVNFNQTIASIEFKAFPKESLKGLTKVKNSNVVLVKNLKDYQMIDQFGEALLSIDSQMVNGPQLVCEIITSANWRLYAFCWNGRGWSIESKRLSQ